MIDASKYCFYWMTGEYNEEFSNWYPCEFVIDDVLYKNVEQYFMAMKAQTFGDEEIYKKIMADSDPSKCKKLGREVKAFDSDRWAQISQDIMFKGNYAKFTQNEKLQNKLLQTGNRYMVEASPYDEIWGIGMWAQQAFYTDETKWPGQNLAGKCLVKVRKTIREEIEAREQALLPKVEKPAPKTPVDDDTTKIAFFDVDGVLAAPIFMINGKQKVGLGSNEDWIRYCVHQDTESYKDCKPVPAVKSYAKKLKEAGATLYVLSTSKTSFESDAKRTFVQTHYEDLFDRVITVASDEMKLDIIRHVADAAGTKLKQCELVEDSLGTLLEASQKGIKGTHISNLVI